jgi:succinate dehydrogenase / fumarate reductase iron-sulfur subunit
MSESNMTLKLKIWRQESKNAPGKMVDYKVTGIGRDQSFLEMLDTLNEQLVAENIDTVVFDHDCREGICGMCSLMIDGQAHGPNKRTTTCQLHMRDYNDGDTIVIEPFRAKAFPIIKDLMVDRTSFDDIIAAGGYVSMNAGNAQDANNLPIAKENAELAMDAAACIGCGACVAACKNASAMLFVSAKISQLHLLPQGEVESMERVQTMVEKMDDLGFGNCTNEYECMEACPKHVDVSNIARMNRLYTKSKLTFTK